jgi:hypothetical protein
VTALWLVPQTQRCLGHDGTGVLLAMFLNLQVPQ